MNELQHTPVFQFSQKYFETFSVPDRHIKNNLKKTQWF